MRKITALLSGLLLFVSAAAFCADKSDAVYQLSTLNALMEGLYDGSLTCKELKNKGDFGIGTFNALDGEMVVLNGKVYRVPADGKIISAPAVEKTPFAVVKFFVPDFMLEPEPGMTMKQIQEFINFSLPTRNIIYAVKITGKFSYVKTRSVPMQVKPYPKLLEVTKTQPVFELNDISGTLVGFRFPGYLEGANLPGYHFHFISDDNKSGGHVLDAVIDKVNIGVDKSHGYILVLPENDEFYGADISGKEKAEKAEK